MRREGENFIAAAEDGDDERKKQTETMATPARSFEVQEIEQEVENGDENLEIPRKKISPEGMKRLKENYAQEQRENELAVKIKELEIASQLVFEQAIEPAQLGAVMNIWRPELSALLISPARKINPLPEMEIDKIKRADFNGLDGYTNFDEFKRELFLKPKPHWYQPLYRQQIKDIRENLGNFEKYFNIRERYVKWQDKINRRKHFLWEEAQNLIQEAKEMKSSEEVDGYLEKLNGLSKKLQGQRAVAEEKVDLKDLREKFRKSPRGTSLFPPVSTWWNL